MSLVQVTAVVWRNMSTAAVHQGDSYHGEGQLLGESFGHIVIILRNKQMEGTQTD